MIFDTFGYLFCPSLLRVIDLSPSRTVKVEKNVVKVQNTRTKSELGWEGGADGQPRVGDSELMVSHLSTSVKKTS